MQPVDHGRGTLAIGLHHNTEPVPSGQVGMAQHSLDHVQRQVQPVCLFGIDVQPHTRLARRQRQFQRGRHKLGHDALMLADLVTRMQRAQLDRDAGIGTDIAIGAFASKPGNRLRIGRMVFPGVPRGQRGLTQHVIGKGISLRGPRPATLDRLANIAAQHELMSQFLHRATDGRTDHRLTQPLDRAVQHMGNTGRLIFLEHLARQHQGPGRGIDKAGGRTTQMCAPFGWGDLVLDQVVNGLSVRHAQQRFGQAHQRDTLVGRKAVLGQEHLHQARATRAPNGLDQPDRTMPRGRADRGIGGRLATQIRQHGIFDNMVGGADGFTQDVKAGHGRPHQRFRGMDMF